MQMILIEDYWKFFVEEVKSIAVELYPVIEGKVGLSEGHQCNFL